MNRYKEEAKKQKEDESSENESDSKGESMETYKTPSESNEESARMSDSNREES